MHSWQCHDATAPRIRERIEGIGAVSLVEVLVRMTQSVGFVRGKEGGGLYPVEGTDTTNSVA
jgi:hypothetical protein